MAKSADSNTADVIPPSQAEAAQEEAVPFERDTEWTIHQRIHACMMEIGHLEKDKEVKLKGGGYEYISHDAVSAAVRKPFIKYGIMVLPTVSGHAINGNRTELSIDVDFINVDRPEDKITVCAMGYGCDPSDKGPGKAYSYALKYAYLKLLMLNSGDDIEEHEIEHEPVEPRRGELEDAQNQARSATETWANNFKAALDTAASIDEINELQSANSKMLMDAPEATREYFVTRIENRKKNLGVASDE